MNAIQLSVLCILFGEIVTTAAVAMAMAHVSTEASLLSLIAIPLILMAILDRATFSRHRKPIGKVLAGRFGKREREGSAAG